MVEAAHPTAAQQALAVAEAENELKRHRQAEATAAAAASAPASEHVEAETASTAETAAPATPAAPAMVTLQVYCQAKSKATKGHVELISAFHAIEAAKHHLLDTTANFDAAFDALRTSKA